MKWQTEELINHGFAQIDTDKKTKDRNKKTNLNAENAKENIFINYKFNVDGTSTPLSVALFWLLFGAYYT